MFKNGPQNDGHPKLIAKMAMPYLQPNPKKLCLPKSELDICVKYFKNGLFSTVVSLQKWVAHFNYMKTCRNYMN